MNIMSRVRLFHLLFALLAVVTYTVSDIKPLHFWLGYGVMALILFRLGWGAVGDKQVHVARLFPSFAGFTIKSALKHPALTKTFIVGILVLLVGTALTGIMMEQGRSIGLYESIGGFMSMIGVEALDRHTLREFHELFANLFLTLAGLHVAHMLTFKWPMSRFMLFIRKKTGQNGKTAKE